MASIAADAAADRAIAGEGTPEQAWQQWGGLDALRERTPGSLLPPGARAVIVAPHPDDEVLACGGLLAQWAADQRALRLVCVTDGEASLPAVHAHGAAGLAARRRREREAGLHRLGILEHAEIVCLALPDGGVTARIDDLTHRLTALLQPGDVVFAPWRQDGHPDHEAAGTAASLACARSAATLHEMPIWMWHWAQPGDPRVPWARLQRVAVRHPREKAAAIMQHQSQLEDLEGEPPTLHPWALARWLRPFEYVFEAGA